MFVLAVAEAGCAAHGETWSFVTINAFPVYALPLPWGLQESGFI